MPSKQNEQPNTQSSFYAGRRLLITGGSDGLGRALVERALDLGAHVVAVARGEDRLSTLAQAHRGRQLHTIAADIADKREIHRIVGEAAAVLDGPIDLLFNNASSLGPTPLPLSLDLDCEDLEAVLATNLIGPFRLTKALLPGMLLAGSGIVVNMSSDAAVRAYPGWSAYGTSKAALDHLSRITDAELAGRGVRVVAVDPGDMNTAMHRAAIPDADLTNLRQPPDVAADMLRFVALLQGIEGCRFGAGDWRRHLEVRS